MAVASPDTETLRLDVEGMTCASCAARIERKLNKLDGVEATVNYATEAASVSFDPASVSVDDLIATVEATHSQPSNRNCGTFVIATSGAVRSAPTASRVRTARAGSGVSTTSRGSAAW